MKVLFTLTPAFNPNAGGVQRTTWKLGKYFTEQGLEVAYYSLSDKGHVEVEYGTLYHSPESGNNDNPANIRDLQQVLTQVQPDVVINQMPYEKVLREALALSKLKHNYLLLGCLRNSLFNFKNNARDRIRKTLPSPFSTLLDNPLGEMLVQWRHKLKHTRDLRAIIDQHDYFVLLAPPNQEELAYFVGNYKAEKVLAIPNSIPGVLSNLPEKEKTILHVGRLNIQQKRSDLLIPFWEQLYERLPDWQFVIVGDGPYYDQLQSEIKAKRIPRVHLEGYQKPEAYYEKSAIFMMPSAYEGFPNTLLEAQSYACAALAFNSYAALEWISEKGNNTFLSTPFVVEEMAEQAFNLASNPQELHKAQEKALANAQKFTIDKVGKMWLDFFKDKDIR